jgi:hypothetical protein
VWTRGYHRESDDSVSSYGGHRSFASAVKDAQQCFDDPDINEVWVRKNEGAGQLGPVAFRLCNDLPHGRCMWCGYPQGQHAPHSPCDPGNFPLDAIAAVTAYDRAVKRFDRAATTEEIVAARAAQVEAAEVVIDLLRDLLGNITGSQEESPVWAKKGRHHARS